MKPYTHDKSEVAKRLKVLRPAGSPSAVEQLQALGVDLRPFRFPGGEPVGSDVTYAGE